MKLYDLLRRFFLVAFAELFTDQPESLGFSLRRVREYLDLRLPFCADSAEADGFASGTLAVFGKWIAEACACAFFGCR